MILLSSDGTPQRDFIHGNDVCEAIRILVNTNEKLEDNIYHISSGKTLTLMELSELIRKEYQTRYNKWIPIITPQEVITDSKLVVPLGKYIICNNKIKTLGFSPAYTINRGINEIFSYLEKETMSNQ
jgi:UDP-glucose 4-epimerase